MKIINTTKLIVDSHYKVILTFSPILEISGHIFECFDYYLFLRQYCNVGIIFLANLNYLKLKILFENKYFVSFNDIEKDIFILNNTHINDSIQTTNIFFGKQTKVILTDGNIESLELSKIVLHTNNLYGFACDNKDYSHIKNYNNIIYLQDYRVYGKNKYFKSINYVKKIPFNFYKKYNKTINNTGLIYITSICRMISRDVLMTYHKMSKCNHSFVIVPYKIKDFDNLNGITQLISPVKKIFDLFDTYIYTPVQRKFDCSPRLLTECFLYHKHVYKQLDYFDIALETRYNDCLTKLQSLLLLENDDILQIL